MTSSERAWVQRSAGFQLIGAPITAIGLAEDPHDDDLMTAIRNVRLGGKYQLLALNGPRSSILRRPLLTQSGHCLAMDFETNGPFRPGSGRLSQGGREAS